jgi:hypothetical protein
MYIYVTFTFKTVKMKIEKEVRDKRDKRRKNYQNN